MQPTERQRPPATSFLLMLATAPPALVGNALALMPAGPVQRSGAALGAAMTVLGFGLGLAAGARSRPVRRVPWIVALAVGGSVALLPGASAAYGAALDRLVAGLIVGGPVDRLLVSLVPGAWLVLLARSAPWRPLAYGAAGIAGIVLVVLTLVLGPAVHLASRQTAALLWPAAHKAAGTPLPELVLVDVDGIERSLSQFRGKLILINVWRTW